MSRNALFLTLLISLPANAQVAVNPGANQAVDRQELRQSVEGLYEISLEAVKIDSLADDLLKELSLDDLPKSCFYVGRLSSPARNFQDFYVRMTRGLLREDQGYQSAKEAMWKHVHDIYDLSRNLGFVCDSWFNKDKAKLDGELKNLRSRTSSIKDGLKQIREVAAQTQTILTITKLNPEVEIIFPR